MACAARTRDCAGKRDGEAIGADGGDGAGMRIGGARGGARCAGERDAAGGAWEDIYGGSAGRSELWRGEEEDDGNCGAGDANKFERVACLWKHAAGPADAGCGGTRARGESGKRAGGHGEFVRLGDLALAPGEKVCFGKFAEGKSKTP